MQCLTDLRKGEPQRKRLASRPSLSAECASELEIRARPSRADRRQFMAGSELKPVSTQKISRARSPKQASSESKPDLEPSRENQGVQMCAGTRNASGDVSRTMSSRSRLSRPRMGRPSEARLPIRSRRPAIARADSRVGAKTRW